LYTDDVEGDERAEQSVQNVAVQHEEMARNNRMGNEEECCIAKMIPAGDKQGQV